MNKSNTKKNVNQAMEDVRKAIQEEALNKTINKKVRKTKDKKEDVLLLTEIYEISKNFNNRSKDILKFKKNIKKLISKDIDDWLNNNFAYTAKKITSQTIKSLNTKVL